MFALLHLMTSLFGFIAILVGGGLVARVTGNRLAGLLYITTPLIWISLGAPILVSLALGLGAVEAARRERWGWTGALAGFAAIIDPGGFFLIAVLALLALRTPASFRRYGRAVIVPTLAAVIVNGLIIRTPVALSLPILLTLAPLIIVAILGWSSVKDQPFAVLVLACGALDTLVQMVVFRQSPTLWIVPGLCLLAASIRWTPLRAFASVTNIALLLISLALPLSVPYPAVALRLPIDSALPRTSLAIPYGTDLSLIGVGADQNAAAGRLVRVQLDWNVRVAPAVPLTIKIDLLNSEGKSVVSVRDNRTFTKGTMTTEHQITMPNLPAGVLNLYVTVTDVASRLGQQPVTRLIVPIGGQIQSDAPTLAEYPNGSQFLVPAFSSTADQLMVMLAWRSMGRLGRDYKFFLHVQEEDQAAKLVSQHDAEPMGGQYPTSLWQSGDVIRDSVLLDLSSVPSGSYRLWFGMYTGDERLQVNNCAHQTVDQLQLGIIRIDASRAITVEQQAPGC